LTSPTVDFCAFLRKTAQQSTIGLEYFQRSSFDTGLAWLMSAQDKANYHGPFSALDNAPHSERQQKLTNNYSKTRQKFVRKLRQSRCIIRRQLKALAIE
jgi:hypothetical protein